MSPQPVALSPAPPASSGTGRSLGCIIAAVVLVPVLALVLVGAAGAIFYLLRASSPSPPEVQQVWVPPAVSTVESLGTPGEQVTLTINTVPQGAEVFFEGVLIGWSPVEVQRPRGSSPLQVKVRAVGYHTIQREVVPEADTVLELVLEHGSDERAEPGGEPTGPMISGTLSRDSIEGAIRSDLATIRRCYEQQLAVTPDLRGRVTIQFVISVDGTVTASTVQSSTLGSPVVEQCVAGAVERIRFLRPERGEVTVSYPFVFSSDQ